MRILGFPSLKGEVGVLSSAVEKALQAKKLPEDFWEQVFNVIKKADNKTQELHEQRNGQGIDYRPPEVRIQESEKAIRESLDGFPQKEVVGVAITLWRVKQRLTPGSFRSVVSQVMDYCAWDNKIPPASELLEEISKSHS